jgi:integrase
VRPVRLSLVQFAALRAYLSGVSPVEACKRFLPDLPESLNESAALQRLGRLLALVADTAERRNDSEARGVRHHTQVLRQCLDHLRARRRARVLALRQLRRPTQPAEAVQASLPGLLEASAHRTAPSHLASLESFAAHYIATRLDGQDPDLSQGEWQDLYAEATAELENAPIPYSEMLSRGPTTLREGERLSALAHAELSADAESAPVVPVPAAIALQALEACRFTVDRVPRLSDRVDTWFTPSTVKRLHSAGLASLQAVADCVAQRARWWVLVPGLGERRARRLTRWLQEVAGFGSGALPSPGAFAPAGDSERPDPQWAARLQEVQLDPLLALLRPGESAAGTALAVQQDIGMLCEALGPYRHHPATLAVYSRELLRFALWCHTRRGCLVASATLTELQAYVAFLQNIPPDWTRPTPALRGTATWRPFRGPLTAASQRKALAALRSVLGPLRDGSGQAGPATSALPRPKPGTHPFDATRAIQSHHWDWLLQRLGAAESAAHSAVATTARVARVSPAAKMRRLRAAVLLLQATGLRRAECVRARWHDLQPPSGSSASGWTLRVGTGRAQRRVTLPPDVVAALRTHAADRAGLYADDWQTPAGLARIPLISVLEYPQRLALQRPAGPAPTSSNSCGALSADGLYKLIKLYFRDCALAAQAEGLHVEPFERVSPHSLRHTFGLGQTCRGTATGDLQQAMGHARRRTTLHYARHREGGQDHPVLYGATLA